MRFIGKVAFVQIQTAHMKQGQSPNRVYDPSALLRVAQLRVTSEGLHGITEAGQVVMDVHHQQHPQTRWRGDNTVSVGFLPYYEQLRARFGGHMVDGVAGENILVACEVPPDMGRMLYVEDAEGQRFALAQVIPAPPCAEFSAFCLGRTPPASELKAALQFLDNGRRGYYALPQLTEARFFAAEGDAVYTA